MPQKNRQGGMTDVREHLRPTDIIAILALVLLAVLYGITRDQEFKMALLGLILFQTGRLSVKRPDV